MPTLVSCYCCSKRGRLVLSRSCKSITIETIASIALFTYSEGPDRTLRPNIQVNGRFAEQELGKFGRAWKTFMQEKYPQRVSEMLMAGMFHATMQAVDEEAENHKEDLIRALLDAECIPSDGGYIGESRTHGDVDPDGRRTDYDRDCPPAEVTNTDKAT